MNVDISDASLHAELRRMLVEIPGVVTAFLGGSLVEGYGNEGSDLDLIILTERRLQAEEVPIAIGRLVSFEEKQLIVSKSGSIRLDIEIRQLDYVAHVRDALLTAVRDNNYFFSQILKQDTLEFVHDLRIGVPIQNHELHQELVDEFPWDELTHWLVGRFEYDAHGHLDDASAAVNAGDAGLALLTSRSTLQAAVDALLASRGATNPKAKWRFRKFESLGINELAEEYLRYETDASVEPKQILRQAAKRIVFSQDILIDARERLASQA